MRRNDFFAPDLCRKHFPPLFTSGWKSNTLSDGHDGALGILRRVTTVIFFRGFALQRLCIPFVLNGVFRRSPSQSPLGPRIAHQSRLIEILRRQNYRFDGFFGFLRTISCPIEYGLVACGCGWPAWLKTAPRWQSKNQHALRGCPILYMRWL